MGYASVNTNKKETFIYRCTGTADSVKIAAIVNDFFNNETAMSMKLVIIGTMGLEFPSAESALIINGTNTRGAICNLDFSNCYIPTITTASRNFLYVSASGPKLVVDGLVVTTTQYGIQLSNTRVCIFNNCVIKTTGSNSRAVFLYGSSINNIFNNCNFTSTGTSSVSVYGNVSAIGGGGQTFNNCVFSGTYGFEIGGTYFNNNIFTGCKFTSPVSIKTENNKFSNCNIEHSQVSLVEQGKNNLYSNCYIYSSSNSAINLGSENAKFINCNIISNSLAASTAGIYLPDWLTSGVITLVNCFISGAIGILVETANVNTEVKVIGCLIKGVGTQDIQQTSAVNTVRWYIMGNTFSRASIIVNGTAAISAVATATTTIYFPTNANKFSRTF